MIYRTTAWLRGTWYYVRSAKLLQLLRCLASPPCPGLSSVAIIFFSFMLLQHVDSPIVVLLCGSVLMADIDTGPALYN